MPKLPIGTFVLLSLFLVGGCRSGKTSSIDFPDGSYQGEVDKKGMKNGKGIYKWHDGSTYEGDFEEDLRHGNGHFWWANGESYKGDYLRDKRTGHGIYHWPDGANYEGSFLNGKRHGVGTYLSSDRDVYVGEWFDDLQHGEGTLSRSDGTVVRGIWRNGKLLTVPAVIPPKAGQPKLSWKQQASPSKDEETTNDAIPLKEDSVDPPLHSSAAPVTTKAFPSATGHAFDETVDLTPTPAEQESPPIVVPVSPEIKPDDLPPEPEDPPAAKGSGGDQNVWEGNREEAELHFATYLINGIDTIFEKKTKTTFSGKMRVTDLDGNILGEFEVLNGRMNGEEVYFDANGFVTERTIWSNGKEIK
jgi:hypothetical protein